MWKGEPWAVLWLLSAALLLAACTGDTLHPEEIEAARPVAVGFDTYLKNNKEAKQTRTAYPNAVGEIDEPRLHETGFGVFAVFTEDQAYSTFRSSDEAFNFMWNQQVTWGDELAGHITQWKYSPVKYWPNDNQPADDQTPASQGSLEHSHLSFFAYAPFVDNASLLTGEPTAGTNDGIIAMSANNTNINNSYIYYRTSLEKPFGPDESVDLLWASQQDLWKTQESGEGYVDGQVYLPFRHALTKLDVTTKLLVDRTATLTSDAYSTELDSVSRVFIDEATITTPGFYPEGKLMIGKSGTDPYWDYTGVTAKTGFKFYSTTPGSSSYFTDPVNYSMRYADHNVPQSLATPITDANGDGIDDVTGLTEAETVKEVFKTMEEGVTTSEKQLAADYGSFLFPPSTDTQAIGVNIKYHVVTFDEGLTLNNPKYYSNVLNDISATLGDSSFQFEPNKHYKLVLNLGLTSAKFEVYVEDDYGEYILLSAVVKSWDLKTIEVNVE